MPSTSTRGTPGASADSGHRIGQLRLQLFGNLRFNPVVGPLDALFERDLRLPPEHLTQPIVVRVAPAHALRTGDMTLLDRDARDSCDQIRQLVDANQPVLTEVDRLLIAGLHQQTQALDAIVDVAEGARLLAVAPDL